MIFLFHLRQKQVSEMFVSILIICAPSLFFGQIENGSFEEWDSLTTITGQHFENPTDWHTNNAAHPFYLTTPAAKSTNSFSGLYALKLESKEQGLDVRGPGIVYKKISATDLKSISFELWCDSLDKQGACVYQIFGDDFNTILSTDSIFQTTARYVSYEKAILYDWRVNHDSIILEFVAHGETGFVKPQDEGYAVMFVDEVKTEFLTAIEENLVDSKLMLYPNPATSIVDVNFGSGCIKNIVLCDLYGRKFPISLVENRVSQIDVSHHPKGIYFVAIEFEDHSTLVKRLVKH